MPEWLTQVAVSGDAYPTFPVIAIRVALAFFLGLTVAQIYRATLGKRSDTGSLPTTLVLLAVLIAVVAMVIGDNIARAFGLVGALSIVRFRTVVEDTRDTGFVIFAVAVGMAAGAGYLLLAAVAVPAVGFSAAFMCWWDDRDQNAGNPKPARVLVRVGLGCDPDLVIKPILANFTTRFQLVETATVKQGSALDLSYRVLLRPAVTPYPLVATLHKVEGVDSVEVKCEV